MRVTIIKDDGIVGVGGVFRKIDLSSLAPEIRAVQWDGVRGHIEYYDEDAPNYAISDISEFQGLIDLYNTPPEPTPAPAPSVPSHITMRQARRALLQSGYLSQVVALIDSMPEDARIDWEFSSVVLRNYPLVAALASSLSLTEAQIDDLFILGATL